jgi:hypothetical protein
MESVANQGRVNMELNGVANLHILVDNLAEQYGIDSIRLEKIKEELDTLERYMVQAKKDVESPATILSGGSSKQSVKFTPWHIVRENKDKFPRNNGSYEPL